MRDKIEETIREVTDDYPIRSIAVVAVIFFALGAFIAS